MESWISGIALHGYSILFVAVFLEAIGLPVPAALALLIAGGASARGSMHGSYALGGALWRCSRRHAHVPDGSLYRMVASWHTLPHFTEPRIMHLTFGGFLSIVAGGRCLSIAKFIPGINTMAPPLAGWMNMRLNAVSWAWIWPVLRSISVAYLGSAFLSATRWRQSPEATRRSVGWRVGWWSR